jgi:CubicO group peptidase (beta-lactamase class C family)
MHRLTSACLAVLLAAATGPAFAQAQSPAPAAANGASVADTMQSALDARVAGLPGVGMIAGVIDGDTVTVAQAGATGTARRLDDRTVFEIGSVTKTFTATVLAAMVRDHSVALDDPVQKYLPAGVHVPVRNGKQITLLELATQHSGLPRLPPNFTSKDPYDPYADFGPAQLYDFLNHYTLTRDPGASYEYSNVGVALLGAALANRAHVSYAELLRRRIFEPLGMNDTAIVLSPDQTARFAVPHDVDGNVVKPWTANAIAPAGGLRSTLHDMLIYLRCQMGRGPLAADCLFAQQPRETFPSGRIGLVWMTGDSVPIVHHDGGTGGFSADIAVSPDRGKGVVVLANFGPAALDDLAFHALDPRIPLMQSSTFAVDPGTLDGYTGDYVVTMQGQTATFTVRRAGDGLTVQLTGQPPFRIYPDAKDHFYLKVVSAQIAFNRDGAGNVTALTLHQGGQTIVAARPGTPPPPAAAPSYPPVVALDSPTLEQYAGTYTGAAGISFVVRHTGDGLEVQFRQQPFFPVYASAKDHFYYKVVDAQLEFTRDTQGKVQGLTLHQNGALIPAVKQ